MPNFAEILAKRIESDPDLTESGLARMAGLDNSTIRGMLKNKRNPRTDTAERICRALGTTVEAFMGGAKSSEEQRIQYLVSELSVTARRELLKYVEYVAGQDGDHSLDKPQAKE